MGVKKEVPRLRRADVLAARATFQEARAIHPWEAIADRLAKDEANAVGPLGRAWYAMSEGDRDAVRRELAEMSGADPFDIDVGLTVYEIEQRAKNPRPIRRQFV